jgi:hypothetical protein
MIKIKLEGLVDAEQRIEDGHRSRIAGKNIMQRRSPASTEDIECKFREAVQAPLGPRPEHVSVGVNEGRLAPPRRLSAR